MEEVRKLLVFFVIGILLFSPFAIAQDETTSADDSQITTQQETQTETQNSGDDSSIQTQQETQTETGIEFDKDPGMTPDNPLYFLDEMFERPGDNPEKALDYKEEKIAEAKVMIEEGKPEKAQQVLEKALDYGDILEREVSPEIKERVKKSSEQVIEVLQDLKEQSQNQNMNLENNLDENIVKEKNIGVAAELASKINELCLTLAKLDPLQYSDVCKSGDASPKWMRERDKELTKEQKEQAKVFVDKLSQCMENPKECDCQGMGIQSFEDFCVEKSSLAIECGEGNGEACREMNEADPSDLLPDYLVGVFYKLKDKYSQSNFEKFMPPECEKAGATSPETCDKIMFKLNAPKECIDAGLDGSSADDERKCSALMFKANSPQECINAGIDSTDPDAPRKCGKLMFKTNAPSQCLEAGLTGERRDDEKRCKDLLQGEQGEYGQTGTQGRGMGTRFDRDCNAIQDANEKMKCYEQFYNNAQVGFSDDFRERELNTKEFAAKMGAANPSHPCPDGVCDQYESSHPGECPEDCGGERGQGQIGPSMEACQSSEQIERLKQECLSRGEKANVENRGGCPWVICVAQYREVTQQQEINVYGDFNPYVKVDRQEPYEPPTQQPPQGPQQPPGCDGLAPDCGPNSHASCQDGRNWVCSTPEPAPTEPNIPPAPAPEPTPTTPSEPVTEPTPTPAPTETPPTTPAPTTGAIFWDYWYK